MKPIDRDNCCADISLRGRTADGGDCCADISLCGRTTVRPCKPSFLGLDAISASKPIHRPRAIKWHYCLPGEAQIERVAVKFFIAPRSVQFRGIHSRDRKLAEV